MKLAAFVIDELRNELKNKTLKSFRLVMVEDNDNSCEWAWQKKDTNIQFIVCVEDTEFHVESPQGPILKTKDPKLVIQAAKTFKSKFNC